jgi:hypothetical protein
MSDVRRSTRDRVEKSPYEPSAQDSKKQKRKAPSSSDASNKRHKKTVDGGSMVALGLLSEVCIYVYVACDCMY